MSDQWLYWASALRGEFLEDLIQRGNPQSGFYRDKHRAIAIWRDEIGKLCCTVSSGYQPRHEDEIDEAFGWCCRKPITREQFIHIREGGKWPEDVAMPDIGDNSAGRSLDEVLASQIDEKQREFVNWLDSIGGEIVTEAHASKAANFADIFQKLEKKADEARKTEKAPWDEKVAEVQSRWIPIVQAAAGVKKHIKSLWENWGRKELQRKRDEEAKRREELARQQREAEEMALERGEAPPPPPLGLTAPPEKVRVSAGTRGKVAMKSRKIVVVTDPAAMLTYFAGLDPIPAEIVEAATRVAKKILEAGGKVPGAELRSEEYAA